MKKSYTFSPKSSIRLFVCLLGFLLPGCRKHQVEADFSLKKYEYAAGDALEFDNLSVNDKSCIWEIVDPEGEVISSYEENNPVIVLSVLAEDGTYILRLKAYNKQEKKESVIEKPFLVKSSKVLFSVNHNITAGDQLNFKVYVDGQYIGKSSDYSGVGKFQTYLPKGLRLIKLVSEEEIHQEVRDVQASFAISF